LIASRKDSTVAVLAVSDYQHKEEEIHINPAEPAKPIYPES